MPENALVYVFSHGQFIQAVRSLVIDVELTGREKMRTFWGKGSPAISNAKLVQMEWNGQGWNLQSDSAPTHASTASGDEGTGNVLQP